MSSGRIKRISSSDRGKSFVNSHFTFEDFNPSDWDEFQYTAIGTDKALETDCYKVEAIKTKGEKVYDKTILYLRKTDHFLIKVDYYLNSSLHKSLENHDIATIDGILTPLKVIMKNSKGDGKTTLEVDRKSLEYNVKLSDAIFKKENLR